MKNPKVNLEIQKSINFIQNIKRKFVNNYDMTVAKNHYKWN